jgi:hypothetical protein
VTFSGATLSGGTDGTNTGTHFAVVNNNTTDATNLAAAIARNGTTAGVTSTSSGAVVTVTATAAGPNGNAITTASGLTGFSWAGSTLANGSYGVNSGTTFKYTASNGSYDTESQLATDLATAFGDNTTLTGAITAAQSTNTVVLTSVLGGTVGNSYTASDSGFTALGTLPNGGDFTGGLGSLPMNTYPAKYVFTTTTASCNDFVVYSTGLAGSSSQATIVGYKNLYATTCTAPVPTVAFAYNTGGTATLSPVLSMDGTQVAFIQSSSNVASLVLLKLSLTSGGTVSSPATATSESLGSYRGCSAPCYTTLTLNGSPSDSNSSPYYIYTSADALYVGDDTGKVHEFTGVFFGTPAEETAHGWPFTATTESSTVLTSPIYDNVSGNIFVEDSSGYLHQFSIALPPSTTAPGTVNTSGQLAYNTGGLVDPPIVDSTTELVYTFIGLSGDGGDGNPSYFNRFAAGSAISDYGTGVHFPNGSSSSNPADSGTVMHSAAFDNAYFSGSGTTGNLYTCVNGVLYQIPLATFTSSTVNTFNTAVSSVVDASTCSPITEFYDGTHDWLFLSVAANGNATGCSGSCLYNYNVEGAGTTGSVTTGQQAAGGSTGIVIDNNQSGTGESQIYYSTLSNQTCNGSSTPVVGNGTGSCGVQASQSNP